MDRFRRDRVVHGLVFGAALVIASLVAQPPAAVALSLTGRPVSVVPGLTVGTPSARGGVVTAAGDRAPRWAWPISPRPPVVRAFDPPEQPWDSGHRGIDLDAATSAPVRAVAAGTVTHVGVIAGRGTVSITHADGVRSTYEPVEATVRLGQEVTRGEELGLLASTGHHCAGQPCLHLGALRGRTYLDPLRLLRTTRIVLLPVLG